MRPIALLVAVLVACTLGASAAGQHSSTTPVIATSTPGGTTYNLKIVSDASPDLSDMDSLVDSTTSRWTSNQEKVWALFYWTHVLKRQTPPMVLHGFEVTDPIRNFSDYGFTMCSTISGINQSLYEAIGLRHQYWDICNHTVSTVEFDGKFRMVDSSMSNLVTTDDGVTLASLQEAAADAARLVRERALYSTSPNGFLTGSDTIRNLADAASPENGSVLGGFARNFCSNGLKLRDYFYNWDSGHRYVLNLRENEAYTRYYRRLGTTPDYWVGSERIASADPNNTFEIDAANRFGVRGNGNWSFSPGLSADGWSRAVYGSSNIVPATETGLKPGVPGQLAEVIYKVQAANAIASQKIRAQFARTDALATATISVSLNHGATWTQVADAGSGVGDVVAVAASLRSEVSGAYETLVRVQMTSDGGSPDGVALTGLTIDTLTQVNIKALPKLNVGRNEIFVGAGDQSDTMVLWPDLRGDLWRKDVYAFQNIASQSVTVPRKYTAVAFPAALTQDAHLTYRMDAPTDITRVVYGGRLHNFKAGSYIDFLHSFDGGATWALSYRLNDISKPYDVIHYETVAGVPPGVRTVLFKFLIHNTNPDAVRASGLYSARMEVNHRPAIDGPRPVDVTIRWKEVRPDRALVERSHRQRISEFPTRYIVNVGGSDHPVMESLKLNVEDDADPTAFGYGDGADAGGEKYFHTKQADGTNVAKNMPSTFSRPPSGFQGSAGAGNTTLLTDGIVGAPATGGVAYWWGQCWSAGQNVELQVDLGEPRTVGAIRAHLFGYPFWDALKGQVQDRIEVQTSLDAVTFESHGLLETSLWRKNIPVNFMLQDDGKATAWNFERTLPAPALARYVRYRVTPARILCASELQVMDRVDYVSFDIGLALPSSVGPAANEPPTVALTAPLAGAGYSTPASVAMTADAADADGFVARAEFFIDGLIVASDLEAPWAATWTTDVAGTYTFTTRVYDNQGAPALSSPVTITVQAPVYVAGEDVVLWAAEAPTAFEWTAVPDATAAGGLRLQNADAGAAKKVLAEASPSKYFEMTFNALAGRGYRLWIRGKAPSNNKNSDSVFVQFDGSLDHNAAPAYRIGTTSSVEYNLEECTGCGLSGWGWQDNGWGAAGTLGPLIYFETSGLHRVRVQVREDGLGIDQIVLSSRRWVVVRPGPPKNDATILPRTDEQAAANQPPTIALTSPANGAAFTVPMSVDVAADASDADGIVARVDFVANGSIIGSATAAPWTIAWNGAPPGGYQIVARAYDDAGAVATSAAIDVIVRSGVLGEDIVLYAAEAAVAVNWSVVADATAAGGSRLQNPNDGGAKILTASAVPSKYFEMTFNALAGRGYRLWIRGKAVSNIKDNDSVFVQFDGSVDAGGAAAFRIGTTSSTEYNLEECTACGLSGWGWQDNGWGAQGLLGPLVYFEHDGAQTIRVQVREDGLGIDQIVLTSVQWVNGAPGPAKNDTTWLPKQ